MQEMYVAWEVWDLFLVGKYKLMRFNRIKQASDLWEGFQCTVGLIWDHPISN